MRLVIEVEGGLVSSVYYTGQKPVAIYVVDLDNVQIGESTEATQVEPEPIKKASDIVIESLPYPLSSVRLLDK